MIKTALIGIISLSILAVSVTSKEVEKELFSFSALHETVTHTVEIDRTTLSDTLDKDGDRLVGAMIRITSKASSTSYVNAMVAACDFDRVILLRSRVFDKDGNPVMTIRESMLLNAEQKASINGLIYTELCSATDMKPYDGQHLFDFWKTPQDAIPTVPVTPAAKLLQT